MRSALFNKNVCPKNIRRHQVWSKLNALSLETKAMTQSAHQHGFANTGHAFKQNMPSTQKGNENLLGKLPQANNAPLYFLQELFKGGTKFANFGFKIGLSH
jgi:hypothetical protein